MSSRKNKRNAPLLTGERILLNLPMRSTTQASCCGTNKMPKLVGVSELAWRTCGKRLAVDTTMSFVINS